MYIYDLEDKKKLWEKLNKITEFKKRSIELEILDVSLKQILETFQNIEDTEFLSPKNEKGIVLKNDDEFLELIVNSDTQKIIDIFKVVPTKIEKTVYSRIN